MSQSPATPNKHSDGVNKHSSKVALPSLEKLASASRVKHASLYEPSPASTYGDTAAGDSVPATPFEVNSHGVYISAIYIVYRLAYLPVLAI